MNTGRAWWLLGLASLGASAWAAPLSAVERELMTTRTPIAQPSPELIRALDLDVPAATAQSGPAAPTVRLDAAVIQQSTQAALAALDALAPASLKSDFDRAWVRYQRADALVTLGRKDEAIAAYEALLTMPRTKVQDRRTRMALNRLGDTAYPGACESASVVVEDEARPLAYPELARARGVEGWVWVMLDVQPGGAVSHVTVTSSSLSVFEKPAVDFLMSRKVASASGRMCFVSLRLVFVLDGKARFTLDRISDEPALGYAAIGAARRIREAAREEARKAALPASSPAGP